MGKILNQQNAKPSEPRPVDRASIRRHNYNRLQAEIKAEGIEKDKRYNKGVFGTDTSSRDCEVSATRAKNRLSQIAFLPGGS